MECVDESGKSKANKGHSRIAQTRPRIVASAEPRRASILPRNGPNHIPSEPDTNETIPNRTPTSLRGSPYCRTSQVGAHAGTANTAITCNPKPRYRNP